MGWTKHSYFGLKGKDAKLLQSWLVHAARDYGLDRDEAFAVYEYANEYIGAHPRAEPGEILAAVAGRFDGDVAEVANAWATGVAHEGINYVQPPADLTVKEQAELDMQIERAHQDGSYQSNRWLQQSAYAKEARAEVEQRAIEKQNTDRQTAADASAFESRWAAEKFIDGWMKKINTPEYRNPEISGKDGAIYRAQRAIEAFDKGEGFALSDAEQIPASATTWRDSETEDYTTDEGEE